MHMLGAQNAQSPSWSEMKQPAFDHRCKPSMQINHIRPWAEQKQVLVRNLVSTLHCFAPAASLPFASRNGVHTVAALQDYPWAAFGSHTLNTRRLTYKTKLKHNKEVWGGIFSELCTITYLITYPYRYG